MIRFRLTSCLLIAFFAVCGAPASAQDRASATPTLGFGSVSSQDQRGGITSGSIQNLYVYPPLARGPLLGVFKDRFATGARIFRTLLQSNLIDEQYNSTFNDSLNWIDNTYTWLQRDVGDYAAERFIFMGGALPISYELPGNHAPGVAKSRDGMIVMLRDCLKNLDMLMREPSLYPDPVSSATPAKPAPAR